MKRREFITLLAGAAAWPFAARAQRTTKVARIGFLGATTPSSLEGRLNRFRAGLRDLGYVEGQNLLIDFRWAEGNYARLGEFAVELVRLNVDVIVTSGTPGTLAAKQATATLPIVMLVTGDAVATGIVASLSHPGGNVTGTTFFDPELHAKRLEICKQTFPAVKRIGILCGAKFGVLFLCEGEHAARAVAMHGAPQPYVEERRRNPMLRATPGTILGRVLTSKHPVQVADVLNDARYSGALLPKLAGRA